MTEQNQTGDPAAEDLTGAQTGDVAGAADQSSAAEVDSAAQVEAFKKAAEEERAKRQAMEIEIEQLRIAQANAPQIQQQQPVRQDVFTRRGLKDDDWLNVAQQREILAEHSASLMTAFQLQSFITQNPDFGDIVGTFGPNGFVGTQTLKSFIKDNPSLRGLDMVLAQNPSYAPVAYQLAKQHKELTELKAKTSSITEHQKAIELANRTGPISSAAAGGGVSPTESVIAGSSDEDFAKLERRVQQGEFG